MRIKAHDTAQAVTVKCTNNGSAVNLTTADSVRMIGVRGGQTIFNDTSPTLDAVNGLVTHRWTGTESNTTGRIWVEVEVTWGDLTRQTFPPFGRIAVDIEADLG